MILHKITGHHSDGRVDHYSYDAHSRRIEHLRPDGSRERYRWDVHGMLLDGIDMIGFERDDLHRESSRSLANHLQQQKSYDDAGRLASLRVAPMETTPTVQSKGQATIQRQYTYDPIGQLASITDNQRNPITYQHDPVGRLIAASGTLSADSKELFNFDPASNLLKEDELIRQQNRDKVVETWVRPAEDDWGNALEIKTLTGESSLSWDSNNRITKIESGKQSRLKGTILVRCIGSAHSQAKLQCCLSQR